MDTLFPVDASRQPVVTVKDGEAMADSRDVAAFFGKRPADVLRDIRNLNCSTEFRQRNFASFKIKDLTGESTSHVEMTKDGFTPLTMSTIEIAELTDKEHRNVMRDARKMLAELHGDGGVLTFEHTHQNPQNGQSYPMLLLPKRECLILVSGYSVEMRARIIDRWMELEEAVSKPQFVLDPSDPKVMLACFDYLQKQVQEKDAIIAVQTEKVKQLDRLEGAKGSMCISDAAKTLGTGRDEQIARWIELVEQKRVISQSEKKPDAGRPEGGVNAAARELGIQKDDAYRAVKVADHSASSSSRSSVQRVTESTAAKKPSRISGSITSDRSLGAAPVLSRGKNDGSIPCRHLHASPVLCLAQFAVSCSL